MAALVDFRLLGAGPWDCCQRRRRRPTGRPAWVPGGFPAPARLARGQQRYRGRVLPPRAAQPAALVTDPDRLRVGQARQSRFLASGLGTHHPLLTVLLPPDSWWETRRHSEGWGSVSEPKSCPGSTYVGAWHGRRWSRISRICSASWSAQPAGQLAMATDDRATGLWASGRRPRDDGRRQLIRLSSGPSHLTTTDGQTRVR